MRARRSEIVAVAAGMLILVTVSVPSTPGIQRRDQVPVSLDYVMTLPRPGSEISFWRPVDVDALPDGSIVVLDGGARTVYLFDRRGAILDSLGREGRGPGEFRRPSDVEIGPNGEIAVADDGNSRVSFWSRNGHLVSSINVDRRLGSVFGLVWNRDGLVVRTHSGFMKHQVVLYRVDVEARTIGTVLARYVVRLRRDQRPASDRVACLYCETVIGPEGEIIVASADTAYRIMQIDSAGRVIRAWQRSGLEPVEFTDAEREHFDALARRAGRPSSGDLFRGFKPRFQVRSLGVDGDGRLWARPTRTFGDPALFDVFGRDREFLGSVRLDRPVRMMFVRGHTLMAVAETREGEPQVFVYRIREVP